VLRSRCNERRYHQRLQCMKTTGQERTFRAKFQSRIAPNCSPGIRNQARGSRAFLEGPGREPGFCPIRAKVVRPTLADRMRKQIAQGSVTERRPWWPRPCQFRSVRRPLTRARRTKETQEQ
jgi:hypothetical protein